LSSWESNNEEAGLVIERDRNHYLKFVVSKAKGKPVLNLTLKNGNDQKELLIAQTEIESGEIKLKVSSLGFLYRFSYSINGKEWIDIENEVDCRENDFHKGGIFTGAFVGIYASSNGEHSNSVAYFDWFDYKENK
jgi:alpha-N-arabinofuranosidase